MGVMLCSHLLSLLVCVGLGGSEKTNTALEMGKDFAEKEENNDSQYPGVHGCRCWHNHDPVCGVNGITYYNKCSARCYKVKVKCKSRCPCHIPCRCWHHYDPVCGVDGKTYSNRCRAEICEGVKVDCKGKCPCKKRCNQICDIKYPRDWRRPRVKPDIKVCPKECPYCSAGGILPIDGVLFSKCSVIPSLG